MPDFIPGVFNYCDRWCERCPLTARCRSFAIEQSIRRRSDEQNATFWSSFDASVPDAAEGLATPSLESEPDFLQESPHSGDADEADDTLERAANSRLPRDAMAYAHELRAWLSREKVRGRASSLVTVSGTACDETLDVLEWYSLQIGVKLMRAMSGQLALEDETEFETNGDEATDEDADEPWQDEVEDALRSAERTDRDGSAKVALIGIERSLGALTVLRREFSESEETLRQLFGRLARLRIEVDRTWPHARTFHRPGFDD